MSKNSENGLEELNTILERVRSPYSEIRVQGYNELHAFTHKVSEHYIDLFELEREDEEDEAVQAAADRAMERFRNGSQHRREEISRSKAKSPPNLKKPTALPPPAPPALPTSTPPETPTAAKAPLAKATPAQPPSPPAPKVPAAQQAAAPPPETAAPANPSAQQSPTQPPGQPAPTIPPAAPTPPVPPTPPTPPVPPTETPSPTSAGSASAEQKSGLPISMTTGFVADAAAANVAYKIPIGPWFWSAFKYLAVIMDTCQKHYSRDEMALGEIRARLAYGSEYRGVQTKRYSAFSDEAHELLMGLYFTAVCVLGRPGMLGRTFKRLIRLSRNHILGVINVSDEPLARFDHPVDRRPDDLNQFELDGKRYHYLTERLGDGTLRLYVTKEENGYRTDYGIVQRYRLKINGRFVYVVVCAGNSSLGTFGAAIFAARMLFPDGANGHQELEYGVPEGFPDDCTFEALLQVTAATKRESWENPNIQPLKMYLIKEAKDGRKAEVRFWSAEDSAWVEPPLDVIVLHDNHLVLYYHRKFVSLSYNQVNGALIRYLAERQLAEPGAIITTQEIADSRAQWNGEAKNSPFNSAQSNMAIVRKTFLHSAWKVTGPDEGQLTCEVRRA